MLEPRNNNELPAIPGKRYFTIGEVSELCGVKPHVLRYWEQEIPTLQPVKTPTGHRLYRREDIDTVLEIKRLLYEEGFTVAGARRHLSEARQPSEARAELEPARPGPQRTLRAQLAHQKLLLDLHQELLAILTLLKRE